MKFTDYILEMVYPQARAIEKIEDLLPQLTKHFIKCWIMQKSRDYDHWVKEIINYLDQINEFSRVKTKRKYICRGTFDKEFGHLTEFHRVESLVDSVCIQYTIDSPYSVKFFVDSLTSFYNDLWNMLSSNKFNIRKMINHLPLRCS